jgi:hypothetical protein
MFKKVLLIFTLVALLLPVPSYGQMVVPESRNGAILKINPTFPKPNQTIVAEVSSLATDIDRANISWSLNGRPYQSGRGLKKVEMLAGDNGSTLNITVTVTSVEGERFTDTERIRVSNVELIWEAFSYTPPFYKGKALASHETLIKVVAMPELLTSGGALINPDNLIYTWRKDRTVLGSLSGIGRQSLIFRMPKLSEVSRVDVEISSIDGTQTTATSIVIQSLDPLVVAYEKHPLFGVDFSRALIGDVLMNRNEINIIATPFYFSAYSADDIRLKYGWRINRSNSGINRNEITLRADEGKKGASSVSFSAENVKEIMQSAGTSFNILFGAESRSTNPFF